jgi:hypothetical protein
MKKVLSFTLYGSNPRYTIGAIKNAILAKRIYPEYKARFYCGSDVPVWVISTLGTMENVEIFLVEGDNGAFRNSWRFLAFSDPDVEIAIMRDTDARITEREKQAVDQWIESGIKFHVMKDHPFGHKRYPVSAGMWGGMASEIRNMHQLMREYSLKPESRVILDSDQKFIKDKISDQIYKSVFIHDTFYNTEVSEPSVVSKFPKMLANYANHVGAAINEDDSFVYAPDEVMSKSMGGDGFFKYDIPTINVDIFVRKNKQ